MRPELVQWSLRDEAEFGKGAKVVQHRSMHPAAAEFVGHRLMKALGFRCAQVKVVLRDELKQYSQSQWICKAVSGTSAFPRLKYCSFAEAQEVPAHRFILIEKIPGAVPLNYLRDHYGIESPGWDIQGTPGFPSKDSLLALDWTWWPVFFYGHTIDSAIAMGCDQISRFLAHGKRSDSLNYAEFYADFKPPEDWTAVKAAIAWNSEEALAIHAARLFLGCTTAHTGNMLVDSEGHLSTIDFEFCRKTDGEEIRQLFANVRPGTRAWEALRGVAGLTTAQIFGLFEGAADYFRSPMGNRLDAQLYFLKRLGLWKEMLLFKEKEGKR
jgi:hypothetical protein